VPLVLRQKSVHGRGNSPRRLKRCAVVSVLGRGWRAMGRG
jgi:hypothetical protein